jgi:superfamily II DNA or RNA helicase
MPLRPYQRELYEAVVGAPINHIVCLPTGAGKTEVAFSVAEEARRRYPHKRVVFLANTRELAQQQKRRYEIFMKLDALQVYGLFGGKSSPPRGTDIFATPAALFNLVGW